MLGTELMAGLCIYNCVTYDGATCSCLFTFVVVSC